MTKTDILKNSGIDYEKGLERFLGDEELYGEVLKSFLNMDVLERSERAFNEENFEELFSCIHEVKGASGNADMTELYKISCELVELLRSGVSDEKAVERAYLSFRNTYIKEQEAIKKAISY